MSEIDRERYSRAMHAMQSGVAAEMEYHPQPTEPKHLRVGVNSALVTNAGFAKLLIEKGVVTIDEIEAAIADEAEAEQQRYEERISQHLGVKVNLR